MRPTCERPTTDSRSNSSKVPVAFAKARRRRSRSTPSGRFISKMGGRPKGTLQEGRRTGIVTETARASGVSGRYANVLPRSPWRSSNPASAASVQTLIIVLLFEQFVQGGAVRTGRLELELQPNRGKQFGELGKAQLSGAAVFKRIERGAANARLA